MKRTTTHEVIGMETDGNAFEVKTITVRITADAAGKSLSLSNEDDCMLCIPLEPIEDRLKEIMK